MQNSEQQKIQQAQADGTFPANVPGFVERIGKKPSAQAEELARKLQEKLRHERPQWLRWVPLLAVVLLGSMAIIAWLLYPAPDAPRLTVTALDVLDVAGEPATVRAYLDPVEAEAKAGSLAGLEATFAIASAEADDGNQRRSAVSDEHGQATATFDAGLKGKTAYQIRQKSPSKKQDAQQDRAHITILDKNTPLLLVDVEASKFTIWNAWGDDGVNVNAATRLGLVGRMTPCGLNTQPDSPADSAGSVAAQSARDRSRAIWKRRCGSGWVMVGLIASCVPRAT